MDDSRAEPDSDAPSTKGVLSLTHRDVSVLCGALAALFATRLIGIFLFPFTDTTEARYAEIARKMVETRDWITPQFDYGVPFWGKPPLHTWLSALGMDLFGVGEFGARIFIFAAALGLLWLMYRWTARQVSRDLALVAITVLASAGLFYVATAFVMTDLPMTVGTTLSMMGFWSLATSERDRPVWGYLFFVGLAIGLMAKGPVAAVLTAMPIGLWILIGNRWRLLKHVPWLSGTALMLALTVPWYAAAELKTPGFLNYFLIGEHFERFVVSGWDGDLYGSGHAQRKGMIWLFWLGMFMPWTLFCLALLPRAGRVVQAIRSDQEGWRSYLLLWVIAPMLLFTPAANILPAYVLPGLPAASLLLVILWTDGGPSSGRTRAAFLAGLALIVTLVLGISVTSVIAPGLLDLKSQKTLIAKAEELAPDSTLYYWGKRTYSGEVYSRGKIKRLTEMGDVQALIDNDSRDLLAIWRKSGDELAEIVEQHFDRIGEFGRFALYIELGTTGED